MNKANYYKMFLFSTVFLTLFGFIMVTSASRVWAEFKYDDALYFSKRQFLFMIIGFLVFFLSTKIRIDFLRKHCKKIIIICFLLLILVIIPGIGVVRGGSRSWFGIGSFAIQPAEVFKLGIIIYISSLLDDNYYKTRKFVKGIIPILISPLLGFLLIMFQPDFGTGVVMLCGVILMCLVSKSPFSNYLKLLVLGILGLGGLILSAPYRLERITAFIDPFSDPLGSGFQIIQSLYAIGPGGLIGLGFDGSIQKHFYLPEPQTDFIFAIVCEELGFLGALFLILLFIMFLYSGFKIAINSNDNYRCFLVFGIISMIGVQIIINLGVVVGLFPVTGITLPFISYGGSSLLVLQAMAGLVYACKYQR